MRTLLGCLLVTIACCITTGAFSQTISISATHDTICAGSSVTFSAIAAGTATPHYQWYKNSASVGSDSTGFTPSSLNNGDEIVCLLSGSVGGPTIALSNVITMAVYNTPVVSAIFGLDTVCRNATITLTNDSLGGIWTSQTTSIATVNAISGIVSGVAGGIDTIIYTITNYCGTAKAKLGIIVKTPPVVAAIVGPNHLCIGAAASLFTDSTALGLWGTSNPTSATIDSMGHATGLNPGNINITYLLTNSCGTTTRTKAVVVSGPPVPGPISGSNSVCQTDTIHLHNPAPGGTWISSDPNVALIIAAGGGGPGATSLLIGVSGGTDTVTYIVVNQCGTDTNTAVITVNPLPVVYPIAGQDSVCPGGSLSLSDINTGGTWGTSDPTIATVDANGNVSGVASGTVNITYSVTNNCGTTTKTLPVYVYCSTSGVNNIVNANSISIYPNPAHDAINIEGIDPARVRIVNMLGEVVKEVTYTKHVGLAELTEGIYFIQLLNSNGAVVFNQRILKF